MLTKRLIEFVKTNNNKTDTEIFYDINVLRLELIKNLVRKSNTKLDAFEQVYKNVDLKTYNVDTEGNIYAKLELPLPRIVMFNNEHLILRVIIGDDSKYEIAYVTPATLQFAGSRFNNKTVYCTLIENKIRIKIPPKLKYLATADKATIHCILEDPAEYFDLEKNREFDIRFDEYPFPSEMLHVFKNQNADVQQ